MTTRTELLETIASGDNSGVEFKRDDLRTQDLAKELVAFSNLEGGMVLLGVEDDGTITGLTRNDLEEWVMNVCRDKIRPAIVPFFEVVRGVKNGIVKLTDCKLFSAFLHEAKLLKLCGAAIDNFPGFRSEAG